jgi:hypothetical protein
MRACESERIRIMRTRTRIRRIPTLSVAWVVGGDYSPPPRGVKLGSWRLLLWPTEAHCSCCWPCRPLRAASWPPQTPGAARPPPPSSRKRSTLPLADLLSQRSLAPRRGLAHQRKVPRLARSTSAAALALSRSAATSTSTMAPRPRPAPLEPPHALVGLLYRHRSGPCTVPG